jgi:hypothetical protein
MNPILVTLLAAWTNWNALPTAGLTVQLQRTDGARVLAIRTAAPADHLTGLVMKTAGTNKRQNDPRGSVTGYYLDRGIFTRWRFVGSNAADTLEFGPQGHIISKQSGGVVDFGNDQAPDRFTFTNRIDVAKCSEKHGFPCHPLNHLQRVLIKNFGPQDTINLQGKIYRYGSIRNGVIDGVPPDRLRVEVIR